MSAGAARPTGGQLGAVLHVQRAEHPAQVGLHRLRADEQLSGDLSIGLALGDEGGDLCFGGDSTGRSGGSDRHVRARRRARCSQRTAPDRANRSAADSSARRAPTFSRRRRRIWPSASRVRPRSIGRSTRSSWTNASASASSATVPVTPSRGKHGSAASTRCQGPRPVELRRLGVPDRQQAFGAREVAEHHQRLDRLRHEVEHGGIADSRLLDRRNATLHG